MGNNLKPSFEWFMTENMKTTKETMSHLDYWCWCLVVQLLCNSSTNLCKSYHNVELCKLITKYLNHITDWWRKHQGVYSLFILMLNVLLGMFLN